MMKLWQKLAAAALMSAAMLGTGLTAKPLLPAPAGTEITAAAANEVTVGDLTFTVYNTYAAVKKCAATAETVTIPEKVSGVPVTDIGDYAFASCQNLREITIPDSVISIGDYAFKECSGLTSVTIPDGVTSIGHGAFGDCSGLTGITIPDSVTDIGMGVFGYCESLTNVRIPDSMTCISEYMFFDCRNLTDITIPDNVLSIGHLAFKGCSSLTGITIPDSVTDIGMGLFSGCGSLTNVRIPDSMTSISEAMFFNCPNLTDITIPDSVIGIDDSAFKNCVSLKSITIPDSVTSIGQDAFSNCPNLTVKGEAGSYAEQYAAENSIPFVQKTFIHSADVKLSKTDFACTGSPVKIGSWITVTVNGRKLTYGTDFVTVYKNNVDVGYQTASVTVKGRGEYAGQITKKFTIKPAKPAEPTLTTANGGIRVTWQRDANADGVLVRYSKNSTFSSGTHDAVYMTKTATDLKKYTKPGETWYVKIYSFIKLPDGTKRGSWSDVVSIKVK